jgi:RNA polymerase-associated protein
MIHLYSGSRCTMSHRARLILNKKDMDFKVIDVTPSVHQNLLLKTSNYHSTPVLIDDIDKNLKKKDLILTEIDIICEYIDERFPHPQFMPIEPTEKARLRMYNRQFEHELFVHVRVLENSNGKDSKKNVADAKKKIISSLDILAKEFIASKRIEYIFSNNFSLLDAAILPLLWRLEAFNITIKPTWANMMKYANKHFESTDFLASLTPAERGMRK